MVTIKADSKEKRVKVLSGKWRCAFGMAVGLLALPEAYAARFDACQVWADVGAYTDVAVHGLEVRPRGKGCEADGRGSDIQASLRQSLALLALLAVAGQRCAFDQSMEVDPSDARSFRLLITPREVDGCTAPVKELDKSGVLVWELDGVQPPRYTMDAWSRGLQGVAVVTVLIDAEGKVAAAVLASSSGHPELDALAFEAANASRFRRKESAERATGLSVARIPFHFNVADSGRP